MVLYAEFHQLESDVKLAFVQIIRQMDAVFLEWQAEEEKKRREDEEAERERKRRAEEG